MAHIRMIAVESDWTWIYFKVKPTRFFDGFNVVCERTRDVKDNFKNSDFSNFKQKGAMH